MHLHGLWLECRCLVDVALAFVKRNNSSYILVNHPIKGKHNYLCPLHTDVSGEICENNTPPLTSIKPPVVFTPLKLNK